MLADELPPTAVELAARGHWSAAWPLVADHWQRVARDGSPEAGLWLHELCLRLGLDGRRRWLARALRRRAPQHGGVRAVAILDRVRRGRLAEAFALAREPLPAGLPAAQHVPWLLAKARVRHELRDHDAAAAALAEAEALAPDAPAVAMERAWALQSADRLPDAIAHCDAAVQRHPGHPGLALTSCWLRHDANSPDLLAHLAAMRAWLQSPLLDNMQANQSYERGDFDTARAIWEHLLAQPWHERRLRAFLHFALLRLHRERGDDAQALAVARAGGRALARHAERLAHHVQAPAAGRSRVVLDVPFVRQDHLTCSPATMASLLAFFGLAVAQREIAAQITWDGTASHDELRWARSRGLTIRFFAWDADVARALLDRGLPFAISTRFETSGHRQALVGYDRVLDTFVLRDPGNPSRSEVDASWLESTLQRGGDCALLLPATAAGAGAPPALPAEAETMAWLDLRLDLDARRLAGTDERFAELLARTSGALHFDIEVGLAHERGDRSRMFELFRQAHERAPDDPYWQYRFAGEMLDQDRWQEARAFLERVAPASPSPFLRRLLAEQWSHDARRRPAALAQMQRALRRLGRDARTWTRFASCTWDDDRRDEATAQYRVAAMLAPTDEWTAGCYFRALRGIGRLDDGLAFLRRRASEALGRSAAPAGTLAEALESVHRLDEAIDVLRQALTADDSPAQRSRLCQLLLRHHRYDEAAALLADASRFAPVDHALHSHALARARHDRALARASLDAAVAASPAHRGAQATLLEHLLGEAGLDAALAYADRLVDDHRDHPALLVDVVEFCQRVDDHARADRLLHRLVAEHPDQHWLRGRLARHLIARGRLDEAGPLLDQLRISSPRSAPVWADLADWSRARGDLDAARAAARTALELQPDYLWPLRLLLNLAPDREAAAATLRHTLQVLLQRPQATAGDDLDGLARLSAVLPAGEFDQFLQGLAANFPDDAAVPTTRCKLLLDDDPAAALPIAEGLVAREPWRIDHHLLVAKCLRAANRRSDERTALEALLRVDPACAQAFVELGDSFDEEGRLPQAIAAFERGLAVAPGHAVLHGVLADAHWRLGDPERALAAAARACDLDPSYAWAFAARVRWFGELGRVDEALAMTARLVRDNPHWAHAHDTRAAALALAGRHEERIAALQQALALSPRLGQTRLRLLDALIAMKRLDEAREVVAAGQALLGDDPALALREAVLLRTQGQLADSRQRLRHLLERHPDFETGWRKLLEWLGEERLADDILALHAAPPAALRDDPVLRGYAGDELQRQGKTLLAIRAFEDALAKDQSYGWAREQLCTLLLERGDHQRVLDLLPDHATPDRLPWSAALLVGRACVASGRVEAARAVLQRLLRDASGRGMEVADLAERLRERAPDRHDEWLHGAIGERRNDPTVWLQWLRILARRADHRLFWRGCDEVLPTLQQRGDLLPLVRMLNDVYREHRLPGLARWVAAHLRPPIEDLRTIGELMYLLSDDPAEQRELLRLVGDDWRRPDIEGWMLANLSGALVDLGQFDRAEQVARHALDAVPHDHSYWWFHRDLAAIALHRRQYAACRAGRVDPPAEYPTVRLAAWQIDLCAELHLLPYWRRGAVLRKRLRRSFRLRDEAVREPRATGDLRPRQLFLACPHPLTLLLLLGAPGRACARWLLRA